MTNALSRFLGDGPSNRQQTSLLVVGGIVGIVAAAALAYSFVQSSQSSTFPAPSSGESGSPSDAPKSPQRQQPAVASEDSKPNKATEEDLEKAKMEKKVSNTGH